MARKAKPPASPGSFTVAIVGRPNVGKSTLFNRLIGKRRALVHDRPGVTRDRKEGEADIAGLRFKVFDTAGFDEAKGDTLAGRMRTMTERAVDDADAALFVIDARDGITPLDESFANILRRKKTPVILVANKCDAKGAEATVLDAFRLGLGEAIEVSAEHGSGLGGLYHALAPFAPPDSIVENAAPPPPPADGEGGPARPLHLAIVGRPNVGKSTLVNRLLGQERMLTGPEPGITRDAIAIDWCWQGRAVRLVDTAGVRKRPKIIDAVEKLAVGETFETIKMAVKDRDRALKDFKERLEDSLAQARGVAVVAISAQTGRRCDELMKAVFDAERVWTTRIATKALNRWLADLISHHPPPLSIHKQRIKLRYMTQVKTRPPTFIIFSSRADYLPVDYMRYLTTGLRKDFGLDGVPLRISLRAPKNPFVDK
jgi:GTP-binding protein